MRGRKIKTIMIFTIIVSSFFCLITHITTADPNIIYVDDSGGQDYTSIQSAINNANPGDTVYVYNGTYVENIQIDIALNLIGEDKTTTIIDGDWNTGDDDTVTILGDNANISGFTIRNSVYYGIRLDSSNCTITDNIITDSMSGIRIYTSFNTVSNNEIISNNQYSIYLSGGPRDNNISNNNISGSSTGIRLSGTGSEPGNDITNNNIFNIGQIGIMLIGQHNVSIQNNILTNMMTSLHIYDSNYITLKNNICTKGGLFVFNSYHNTIESNSVNGKPIVYLEEESNINVDAGAGQVCLVNCDNVTVIDQNISNVRMGIQLDRTNNCLITQNTIDSVYDAIDFRYSKYNTIIENTVSNNDLGIIMAQGSPGNLIYHNNIISNSDYQGFDETTNYWNDSYPSGGNYWSDYTGTDADGDGIGDTPHSLDYGSSLDYYPLMEPYVDLNNPPDAPENPSPYDGEVLVKITEEQADTNGDGKVSLADCTFIGLHLGEIVSPPGSEPYDVNADGIVTMSDISLVQMFYFNKEVIILAVGVSDPDNDIMDVSFYWDMLGDINDNGEVADAVDLTTILSYVYDGTEFEDWQIFRMDLDDDGDVDQDDVDLMLSASVGDIDVFPGSLIDIKEDVPSGEIALITTDDLELDIEYRWYAIADDEQNKNTSDIFTFEIQSQDTTVKRLEITNPSSVNENEDFLIKIEANSTPVENVKIQFADDIYYTNSNGQAILNAPSVNEDTYYTITATKTGYQSDTSTIKIVDTGSTIIELLAPNGGEICSDIYNIVWRITNPSNNPSIVDIYYKIGDNNWIILAENVDSNSNLYEWNTITVSGGYPYKTKIVLKEDSNSDGSYETILSSDISDSSFGVDNSEDKIGWINGFVTEEINNEIIPVENARVVLIISDDGKVITSKSTLTDETGKYNISSSFGTFKIKVSKQGYISKTKENQTIWPNYETIANFTLVKGDDAIKDTTFLYNENRELIDAKIRQKNVGGEISITYKEDISDFEKFIVIYDSINVNLETIEKGNMSLSIDGNETSGGKTIVLNFDIDFFESENLEIYYDDQLIEMADDIIDILNPNDDGSNPEFLLTMGSNGTQILISIPHFSQHHISISSAAIEKIVEILFDISAFLNYILIGIFIAILYIGPVLYLRKK